MRIKGIDVSSYQGDINFEQVKNSGIDFVIIKAGEWNHTVDKFEGYYEAAKAAGLHIGFYWFCDGETISEIEQEADACIAALNGKQFDFPIYMDMENSSQYCLGRDFCSDAVRTFCGKLENAGYFTGLYTAASWLDSVIDDNVKKKYTLWVADWRGYCGYDGDYGVWQYGAGYVPGIGSKTAFDIVGMGYDSDYPGVIIDDSVDLNYAYTNFHDIIIPQGFNNYPKPDPNAWENDPCHNIGNILDIQGTVPALSGDKWFLLDKSCTFSLETLPYARVNIYLVGGGEDGAEWQLNTNDPRTEVFNIPKKCRGGCVLKKELYITGNVDCQAFVAAVNDPTGTSIKIGSEVYKCTDPGYFWRKATASGNADVLSGGNFNAENGANGINTPYGYVGSSGGGGGGYSINTLIYNQYAANQYIEVYPGKGGAGAGDGGAVKQNGNDAVNYGCGGGSAGFGGYPSDGDTVETNAGRGKGGCIIFELLDSGACDGSPNKPKDDSSCGCGCECPHHEFECDETSNMTEHGEKSKSFSLKYDGGEPVITQTETTVPLTAVYNEIPVQDDYGINENSNCGCGKSSNGNTITTKSNCGCSGNGIGNNGKCVNFNPEKWGENWLLFNKSGDYSLTMDEDITLKIYLVGGGCDGKDGMYYNKTAYGGDGGRGGYYNVVRDVKIPKGEMTVSVGIGGRGDYAGTFVVINNIEYCCNGKGSDFNNGGFQGVSGKHNYCNGGNGANGIETPFGYIGSSGGGGAAYCNQQTAGYGKGGLYAGNGGKIVNGKSTPGNKAMGYGCGGGGGTASPTSWCEGGKGKQGCVIISW